MLVLASSLSLVAITTTAPISPKQLYYYDFYSRCVLQYSVYIFIYMLRIYREERRQIRDNRVYVSCPVERLRALLQTLIVPADLARRYSCQVTSVRPPPSRNKKCLFFFYFFPIGGVGRPNTDGEKLQIRAGVKLVHPTLKDFFPLWNIWQIFQEALRQPFGLFFLFLSIFWE